MQNLNKILGIIIIATSVIVWIYLEHIVDTPAHDPTKTETTSKNAQKHLDTPSFEPTKKETSQAISVQNQIQTTSNTETQTNNQTQCISQQQYDQDERHHIVANYIKYDYLNREIDYINYLDNQELEKLALDGNVKAMYILGMNYRWNAIYHNDKAEQFRPQEIEKQPIKPRKEFNHQSWRNAHYWLEKAARHGQIVALMDIAVGYQQHAYFLEEQGEVSDKMLESLKQNALVYMQLHQHLAPEFSEKASIQELIDELKPENDKLLALLKRRWKNDREALGLNEELDLNIPPEIAQLEQLKNTICKQNNEE